MNTNDARVLMLLTSTSAVPGSQRATGLWIEEFADPYYAFAALGMHVSLCSVLGGHVPIDPDSWEPDGRHPPGITRFKADIELRKRLDGSQSLKTLGDADFDLLYIPGGHGTLWDLPDNPDVHRLIAHFLQRQRPIAAVCHGPAAFIGALDARGQPLLQGLKVTAFSDAEEDYAGLRAHLPYLLSTRFREAGAHYQFGTPFESFAIRDNLIISGQNPQSSAAVIDLAVAALNDV